jgi:hypothetical protein
MIDNDDVDDAYNFFGEIITELMVSNVASGDTIATALCLLSHDILKGQHMDDDDIESFVDAIFPRGGYRLDLD